MDVLVLGVSGAFVRGDVGAEGRMLETREAMASAWICSRVWRAGMWIGGQLR